MDWQARYLAGETPWDKGVATPSLEPFVSLCAETFNLGKSVLVPGCGLGHDVAVLATLGHEAVGWDIAPAAVEQANALYASREGASFALANLFETRDEPGFDWAWEHTCFCAIEPSQRRAYMESLAALVKDGGYLAGVFFLNPDVEPGEGPPFGATVEEICEAAKGVFELVLEAEPAASYEGREGRERMLLFRKTC